MTEAEENDGSDRDMAVGNESLQHDVLDIRLVSSTEFKGSYL